MTEPTPHPLAVRLLTRFAGPNEPLIGDVLEEFHRRQSHAWLWRQVLMMGLLRLRSMPRLSPLSHLGLSITPGHTRLGLPHYVNDTPGAGLGGFGIFALFIIMVWVMAAAWSGILLGFAGGVAMGALLIALRRGRGLADPHATRGMNVFDGPPSVGRAPLAIVMNMSAIEVSGIGGLGLVAMAVLVSIVVPQLRWPMSAAVVGGAILGTVLVAKHRKTGLSDPKHPGPAGVLVR